MTFGRGQCLIPGEDNRERAGRTTQELQHALSLRARAQGRRAVPPTPAGLSDSPLDALGDSQFADLYNEHSKAIYYLALRLLSDPEKAQDATHDVFLKAFRKMDQFRGESSWRTWLYRIAINHCRNLQQGWNERHMLSNADDAIWETTAAKSDSPLRVLETKELGQRIQKALDGLPPEYGCCCCWSPMNN